MSVQNYQMHAPQRSNSTGSLSEKSQASTGIELGFNCDSPQGGTIRKKPKPESENKPKPAKGVRFKESFATIPISKSIFQGAFTIYVYRFSGFLTTHPPSIVNVNCDP